MKRLHVHLGVPEIDAGIDFYTTLFGTRPNVVKKDYAKWMLDDPSVNFAISTMVKPGVDHLGIQTDDPAELAELDARASAAGKVFRQEAANCCYAKSDKAWVQDPAGVAWENFHTLDHIPVYGDDRADEVTGREDIDREDTGREDTRRESPPAQQAECCG